MENTGKIVDFPAPPPPPPAPVEREPDQEPKAPERMSGRQAANIHQFIISPIEAHSKKPDEAREKIVALMGDLPRVELFARQSPPGWEVWGNEVASTVPDFGTKCPEDTGAGKEVKQCLM